MMGTLVVNCRISYRNKLFDLLFKLNEWKLIYTSLRVAENSRIYGEFKVSNLYNFAFSTCSLLFIRQYKHKKCFYSSYFYVKNIIQTPLPSYDQKETKYLGRRPALTARVQKSWQTSFCCYEKNMSQTRKVVLETFPNWEYCYSLIKVKFAFLPMCNGPEVLSTASGKAIVCWNVLWKVWSWCVRFSLTSALCLFFLWRIIWVLDITPITSMIVKKTIPTLWSYWFLIPFQMGFWKTGWSI